MSHDTMLRSTIWHWMRLAAVAAAVSLTLGSLAWGYDDYDRHDEASERGYQNGYRDGLHAGDYDRERGRRFNFKNDDWEDSRGYEHWMGSHGRYKQAYRDGYERGYRRSYGHSSERWDRNDYRRHDRDDWH